MVCLFCQGLNYLELCYSCLHQWEMRFCSFITCPIIITLWYRSLTLTSCRFCRDYNELIMCDECIAVWQKRFSQTAFDTCTDVNFCWFSPSLTQKCDLAIWEIYINRADFWFYHYFFTLYFLRKESVPDPTKIKHDPHGHEYNVPLGTRIFKNLKFVDSLVSRACLIR